MKKIDELRISPRPWKILDDQTTVVCLIDDDVVGLVADCHGGDADIPNARLIAAAPELYECLREAVVESCAAYCGEHSTKCRKKDGVCFVQKWRAAIAQAAGEETTK